MSPRGRYAFVNDCWGGGNSDRFVNNTCIANSVDGGFRSDCKMAPLMVVSGNTIYNEDGVLKGVALCDKTNKIGGKWPTAKEVINMGRKVIGFAP